MIMHLPGKITPDLYFEGQVTPITKTDTTQVLHEYPNLPYWRWQYLPLTREGTAPPY